MSIKNNFQANSYKYPIHFMFGILNIRGWLEIKWWQEVTQQQQLISCRTGDESQPEPYYVIYNTILNNICSFVHF